MTATVKDPIEETQPPEMEAVSSQVINDIESDPEYRHSQRILFLEGVIEDMSRPQIGETIRFTRFIAGKISGSRTAAQAMNAESRTNDRDMIMLMMEQLDETSLLEFGDILLCGKVRDLEASDLDLIWITAGVARWCELLRMSVLIKNVRRVAAAFR